MPTVDRPAHDAHRRPLGHAATPPLSRGQGEGDKTDATATSTVTVTPVDGAASPGPTRPRCHAARCRRQDLAGGLVAGRGRAAPDSPAITTAIRTTEATRGNILDGYRQPDGEAAAVVDVGIEPQPVTDLDRADHRADQRVHARSTSTSTCPACRPRSKRPRPTRSSTVVTLRRRCTTQIRSQIHDLPGTVFQTSTPAARADPDVRARAARQVDDVTKEQMDTNPGKYQVGDQVGYGGIAAGVRGPAARHRRRCRWSSRRRATQPTVRRTRTTCCSRSTVGGRPVGHHQHGRGRRRTRRTRRWRSETKPAAIIAMRISDGAILAVANGPGAAGHDLALTAQVPPGSTFKMVTATNVLESGAETPSSMVNCPAHAQRRRPDRSRTTRARCSGTYHAADRLREVLQHRVRLARTPSSAPTACPDTAGAARHRRRRGRSA